MSTRVLHVVGAGGHGKVVLDALLETGWSRDELLVSDSNEALRGMSVIGFTVRLFEARNCVAGSRVHVAIGNSGSRRQVLETLERAGCEAISVVHPAATLSRHADLGQGSFVAAQAVVAASSRLGRGTIVNHAAVVDHDCDIGEFAHIAPNATLGGGVRVGAGVLVGAGAVVLPGLRIGENAIVGAGAVVVRDVDAGTKWAGVPATRMRRG